MSRRFSLADRILIELDRLHRNATGAAPPAERANPAGALDDATFDDHQRRHAAGLMRINHTGEVCAQALYQGQALTAGQEGVRGGMQQAAREEIDHLAWCAERVEELGEKTSVLNPLFYGMSFALGAVAGALGDRVSLGFVAATEDQVCAHLREHLQSLPPEDRKSRAILAQMLEDESRHGTHALESGGLEFPPLAKSVMTLASRLMTASTYRI
jgi:3-demethoxyubiquinol 3-hydroxylase